MAFELVVEFVGDHDGLQDVDGFADILEVAQHLDKVVGEDELFGGDDDRDGEIVHEVQSVFG